MFARANKNELYRFGRKLLGKEYAGLAHYAGLIPLLDKLARLSPRDIRIIEGVIQLMYAESGGK